MSGVQDGPLAWTRIMACEQHARMPDVRHQDRAGHPNLAS